MILRSPDDDDGNGKPAPKDDDKPAPAKKPDAPAGPPTVPGVQKTPLKHPSVIALEKKVSELEDKTDGLQSALDGVNSFLEGLQIGGPAPVKIPVKDGDKKNGGFLDDLDKFIFGAGPKG